jgi:uncharacterized membrane protein
VLPDPLHPAVVHLPIALAVVIPLLATAGLLAIRRGFLPARAWIAVALLQVLLAGSTWLAADTGGDQYDRVKEVVDEHRIDEHAEAAEWFEIAAIVNALICTAGLLPDRRGQAARLVGTLASLLVLATAVRTGYLGGELVYRHGAAKAYTESAAPAPQ